MANTRRNDIGSLVLSHATTSSSSFRPWNSFSASSLRRALLNAFRCGGSGFSHHHHHGGVIPTEKPPERRMADGVGKSEKLCDLLDQEEIHEREEYDVETKRKEEVLEKLKRVVKDLQCEDSDDREKRRIAASKIRLIAREEAESRATLAILGSIPPLVGMLDCADDVDSQIAALYALLNLEIGNDENKAAIVKAGSVHKMVRLITSPDESATNASVSDAVVANFLALSALDANKSIIGTSGAIPFLVNVLIAGGRRSSSPQAKQESLRALYNLSILRSNIPFLLETHLVPFFFFSLGDMDLSERILNILTNIVATDEGRKSIRNVRDAFGLLVDVLNWTDSPTCQEKASYILMVMAHKSYSDRYAMIEAGIMSALLELTLLGSTLAQKRASRILECLRKDKSKEVSENLGGAVVVSAPIDGSSSSASFMGIGVSERMMSEEKKAVQQLVQQSLQNTMKRIAKRANLPLDFVPSDHFMSIAAAGSTSKSLPF